MFGSFKLDEAQILEAVLEIRHLEQYSGFHWVSHFWETENCVVGSFVLTLRQLIPFFPHPLYTSSKQYSIPEVERGLVSLDLLLGDSL